MRDLLIDHEKELAKITINPNLRSDITGPYIQQKLDRMAEILSTLKEPISVEKLRALHHLKTPQ